MEADVVVIGAGSVGSMASWQLAARGLRVVGIDRFPVPGPFSAYAGESRVFRMVYAEGGHYTPLLQRARDLWRELEAATGAKLLEITGVVTIMDHDNPDHAALLRAGRERGLAFEVVTGTRPARACPSTSSGTVTSPVRPGRRLRAQRARGVLRRHSWPSGTAQRSSANGTVTAWTARRRLVGPYRPGGGSRRGCWWRPERAPGRCAPRSERTCAVLPGPDLVPIADPGLLGRRRAAGVHPQLAGRPVLRLPEHGRLDRQGRGEHLPGRGRLDGQPAHLGSPSSRHRPVLGGHLLPALVPEPVKAVLCADGYTADETGLLGLVPGMDGVVVAVGFSGHGFKMASALGAVAADLLAEGTTATDISFMDPARFLESQRALSRTLPPDGTANLPGSPP